MADAQATKVVTPNEVRKAPYRVPEDAGFFAPREPVAGEVPASVSQPPEPRPQPSSPPDDPR